MVTYYAFATKGLYDSPNTLTYSATVVARGNANNPDPYYLAILGACSDMNATGFFMKYRIGIAPWKESRVAPYYNRVDYSSLVLNGLIGIDIWEAGDYSLTWELWRTIDNVDTMVAGWYTPTVFTATAPEIDEGGNDMVKYQMIIGDGANVVTGSSTVAGDMLVKGKFNINNITVMGDGNSGSCQLDICKKTSAEFTDNTGTWTSICTGKAIISSARGNTSVTATTTEILDGSVLRVYVDSCSTFKRILLNISGVLA